MSAFTNPLIIGTNGKVVELERIPLRPGGTDQFSEKWLQEILFQNPGCLPVREIDPHIGDLIPICTEIETGAGPADILYVTPTGQIILVETKLWRNPEARREVVAQILDYAKQLTSWTYEDLAREAAIASKKGQGYLAACLKAFAIDEASFVDGVNRSLKNGDFLLLIVGDGIRSGAQALVGFMEQYGNLRFGMGLIEVAAFRLTNDELILHPRILAKTEILKRTVLVGAGADIKFEELASIEDNESKRNSDALWYQTFWEAYLEKLQLDDPKQPMPNKSKSTNLYLGMPPGMTSAWLSAYIAKSQNSAGVYLTFYRTFDKLDYYYDQLLSQQEEIEANYGERLHWERKGDKIYINPDPIAFTDINDPTQRERVIIDLADMTNRMVNVFRHRLEEISDNA